MRILTVLMALSLAALLEAGGDAIVRGGLHSQGVPQRIGVVFLGGLVLTAYGVFVNTPQWDFGKLLGIYVCLFFLSAQVINAIAFKTIPSLPIVLGGLLIVSGGLLITFWRSGTV
jgi:small multidrug resistance family-3 protein